MAPSTIATIDDATLSDASDSLSDLPGLSDVDGTDMLESSRPSHNIKRALLHFVVNAPDEFADDAEADQLHSAKEKNDDDRRCPAACSAVLVSEEFFREEIEQKDEAHARCKKTEIHRQPERRFRKRENSIDGET